MAETYRYYIPYLIRDRGDEGWGFSFTTRPTLIETQVDVEEVISDLEKESGLAPKSILLLDWKRLD